MACMCFCTGLTWAAPKKNNKKSSDHNSDLIPIPDDLLENYNMPSGKPKFLSKSFFREFNFTKFFVKSKLRVYRKIERLRSRFRFQNKIKFEVTFLFTSGKVSCRNYLCLQVSFARWKNMLVRTSKTIWEKIQTKVLGKEVKSLFSFFTFATF